MAEASSSRPETWDMAAVHTTFRTSLASAPAFIESAFGDDHRRTLIASYYSNVLAFLEVHHEGEDEYLFPLLIERVPEQRALVELAIKQHEQVLAFLATAKTATASWEGKGDSEGPESVRLLRSVNEALIPHLDHEEATIVPLAAVHLSAEEWGMLARHTSASFKGDKGLMFGLNGENFTTEQRAIRLDRLPPELRQWWNSEGEPSFNALIAEVRQTRAEADG